MKRILFVVGIITALLLNGCASLQGKPEAPELSVLKVVPQKMGLGAQVFRFTLNAHNPNAFSLPIEGIEFVTRFSGVEVGKGVMDEMVTLAPNADTPIELDVQTDMSKLVKNLGDLFTAQRLNFDYEVNGNMQMAKGSLFSAMPLPFSVRGNLLEEKQK